MNRNNWGPRPSSSLRPAAVPAFLTANKSQTKGGSALADSRPQKYSLSGTRHQMMLRLLHLALSIGGSVLYTLSECVWSVTHYWASVSLSLPDDVVIPVFRIILRLRYFVRHTDACKGRGGRGGRRAFDMIPPLSPSHPTHWVVNEGQLQLGPRGPPRGAV